MCIYTDGTKFLVKAQLLFRVRSNKNVSICSDITSENSSYTACTFSNLAVGCDVEFIAHHVKNTHVFIAR